MSLLHKNAYAPSIVESELRVSTSADAPPPLRLIAADPFHRLRANLPIIERNGMSIHFFEASDGGNGRRLQMDGRRYTSFSSYDYLGYASDPRVHEAAKEAIDRYGTSASASRLIGGERTIHRELEQEIAGLIGTEDSLTYVSGHATNVSTLGCLFGPDDLILYDALCHNSIQQGIRLSGAAAHRYSHNNIEQLDRQLRKRKRHGRTLIVTEGVFSMDGDIAPIPELIEIKRRHGAYLMVDKAHSMGVIGPNGRGISEYFSIDPTDVDIWMGTLSKSLGSCGGYIAGSGAFIESLRYAVPGFVYSCGLSPANTASALAAARLLRQEPQRVRQLAENVKLFRSLAHRRGLNTGLSNGSAVIPITIGCSLACLFAAHLLYEQDILVYPLFYPVVPTNTARLRFFVTASHTADEIERAVEATHDAVTNARRLADAEHAQF